MTIYNRWGELVYKTTEGCEPINGKYISGNDCGAWNGKRMNTNAECEQGEYLFMIRFVDSNFKAHDYNGIVYLIR